MNKEAITLSIKRVFTDQPFMFLMAGVIVAGLTYVLAVAFNIHTSDVTVYSRYTAFGEAHFYKGYWQYLLAFVAYGVIVTAIHLSLMVKFHNLERRQTAIIIGWLGIAILAIGMAYALAVLQLGRSA